MKLSLGWIRDINKRYAVSADPAPDGVDKLVEKIGAQLGAVDEVIDLGKRYQGIVVVKVVSVEKHPGADKLTVCLVDDGKAVKGVKRDKNGLVQIVCGAPNVKPTLGVAWIPPGVAVPATYDKKPFVLETREIRGIASNGMLASPKELGIGDSHEGLLIIDEPVKPGTPFAEVYSLDDHIIDIENKMFTHRPDLFGMLGLFREVAGIQDHVFKSPAWYRHDAKLPKGNSRNTHPLKVENKVPKLVPRFVALVIKDVKVGPSPAWLQARLASVGIRSINNIVDLTNYEMLESSQPLHAYDYDKLSKNQAVLGVRLAKKGEELILLGGKKIRLEGEEVVITDGKRAIGLGGIMGGVDTEVDENTKAIILECANFDMNATRRSAMAHGLFTDAATRFTKGQSPLQNVPVAARAVLDLTRLAGGRVVSAHDDNHLSAEIIKRGNLHQPVKTTAKFINSRLGLELTAAQIAKILINVEFKVLRNGDKLDIAAPFWRTDIAIPEDVVEEVGRLYGYDHLPQVLPSRDLAPVKADQAIEFKSRLRWLLAAAGGNEVLTYSFVDDSLLRAAGQDNSRAFHIRNALSPQLKYYRQSLTPSLLEKVQPNLRLRFERFMLFEIGKAHIKGILNSQKLPEELERLAIVQAAGAKIKASGSAYFDIKYTADLMLSRLGIPGISYQPLRGGGSLPAEWAPAAEIYDPGRSALVMASNKVLGLLGEPSSRAVASMKLPARVAQAEFDLKQLVRLASPISEYAPLNRFPKLEQDICLRTSTELSYAELTDFVEKFLASSAKKHGYGYGLQPLDIFQRERDGGHKQTTWRIRLWHPERTLTTEETNKLLDDLADEAKVKLKAERV